MTMNMDLWHGTMVNKMKRNFKILLLAFFIFILGMNLTNNVAFADNHFVYDNAHVINDSSEKLIQNINKNRLTKFDGHPTVSIITIKTLPKSQTLDSYALKMFNKYHLGHKGYNNGVLFVIVTRDHKLRMQLGSGIKHTISNTDLPKIFTSDVKNDFKVDDFSSGSVALVNNTYTYLNDRTQNNSKKQSTPVLFYVILIIIILIIVGLVITIIKSAQDLRDPDTSKAAKAKILLIGSAAALVAIIGLIITIFHFITKNSPDDSAYDNTDFGGDGGFSDDDSDSGSDDSW